ncbi:MAG: MMPL family transporter, partial [Burkholderiales bacterium]
MQALTRFSARHPAAVLLGWLAALLVAALLIARFADTAFTTTVQRQDGSESVRVEALLRRHFPQRLVPDRPNEIVVVRSAVLTVDDPEFRAQVEAIGQRLFELGGQVLAGGTSWYLTGDPALVSADRRSTLIPLILHQPQRDIDRVQAAVRAASNDPRIEAHPVGRASVGQAFKSLAEADMRAELRIGVPAALVVLLVAFSTVVAALVPLVLAAASIAVALALLELAGTQIQAYFVATNMIVMMGLAVGIDYSLFFLARLREERQAGHALQAAIAETARSAGRAVMFSGATVVLALLGLLLVPTNVFRSIAAGAVLVVLVAMLACATLLPAIVALLGDRLDSLRLPFAPRGGGGRGWARIAQVVTRRPVASLIVSTALLVAAALPALRMNIGFAGIETLPDTVGTKQAFQRLQRDFPIGVISEAVVWIEGDPSEPSVAAAIDRLRGALGNDAAFFASDARLRSAAGGTATVLVVPMRGEAEDPATQSAIERLRTRHVPEAFAGSRATALVGGNAAGYLDFFGLTARYTPVVVAFVLGLSFVLLTVAFRSIVVPLKAILMNLLSVGAACGLVVLVFQDGVGASFFGFTRIDRIEAWIPLFLFVVLYGLSMDYHVLLLARIRERYVATGSNAVAVADGLRTTAGIITGAALIMVAIFAGFAAGELVMFQQVGFGLAV